MHAQLAGGGGARGAKFAAKLLKTVVAERTGDVAAGESPEAIAQRVLGTLDKVKLFEPAPADGVVRLVAPFGIGGVQKVPVDITRTGDGVVLRVFTKGGLGSRSAADRVADEVWAVIAGAEM
jgi:hypothetical protein